jgi:hypothetical protein
VTVFDVTQTPLTQELLEFSSTLQSDAGRRPGEVQAGERSSISPACRQGNRGAAPVAAPLEWEWTRRLDPCPGSGTQLPLAILPYFLNHISKIIWFPWVPHGYCVLQTKGVEPTRSEWTDFRLSPEPCCPNTAVSSQLQACTVSHSASC